jgi:hypothetical protein
MGHIFLYENEVIMRENRYYRTSFDREPVRIKEIKHYTTKKVAMVYLTVAAYNRVIIEQLATAQNIIFPNNAMLINARIVLVSKQQQIIWYAYDRMKTINETDIRLIKIDFILQN